MLFNVNCLKIYAMSPKNLKKKKLINNDNEKEFFVPRPNELISIFFFFFSLKNVIYCAINKKKAMNYNKKLYWLMTKRPCHKESRSIDTFFLLEILFFPPSSHLFFFFSLKSADRDIFWFI